MSGSGALNPNNYKTVWDHNFSTQPNFNGFDTIWGDVQIQNGAAVLTSTAANGWPQAGFMITPSGPAAGNGYGLYSITMSMNDYGAVEGPGGYACLWPSTNNWPGPELDLIEKGDASSGTNGYSTIHWAGSDGSNQYNPTFIGNYDVTQKHTYAMDWEPGRITMYVDGHEIYTTTQHVPKDYADGGQNEAFGAGEEPAWAASMQGGNTSNQIQVYDISYSAYTGGGGGGDPSISLSNPGTLQEQAGQSSVSATETVHAKGLSTIYEAVFTSGNVAESGWHAVNLSGGQATFTATFEHTGDRVVAVDNPNSPSVKASSGPVTILPPHVGGTISLSNPGTLQEQSGQTSVSANETVNASGVASVYAAVFTADNVAECGWQPVSLDGSGVGVYKACFKHTGDKVVAVNNPNNPTVKAASAPVTIEQPSGGGTPGTPSNIQLNGDALNAHSPAWTVVGTLSATDTNPVWFALGDNPNHLFSIDGNKLLIDQNMPANPASSYQVGIFAVDSSTGNYDYQTLKVGVGGGAAAIPITAASVLSRNGVGGDAASFAASAGGDAVGSGQGNDATLHGTASASGGGAETFTYQVGDGLETIADFNAARGDVLDISRALEPTLSMHPSGAGTLLELGGAKAGIMLQGVSNFDSARIHWI